MASTPIAATLAQVVSRQSWVLIARGIFAILFGVMAFAWPGLTLTSLVLLYGLYCLADGFVGLAGMSGGKLWQSILVGCVSIAAGLVTFAYPGLTALLLLYLIAAWAIMRGIFEIAAAIEFRKVIEGEFFLGLAGLLSILFGILIVMRPGAGALSIVWILGTFAILSGVMMVAVGLKVRQLAHA